MAWLLGKDLKTEDYAGFEITWVIDDRILILR